MTKTSTRGFVRIAVWDVLRDLKQRRGRAIVHIDSKDGYAVSQDEYISYKVDLSDSGGAYMWILDSDQRIGLQTTKCNAGGERYWFTCPYCFTKVGVLYRSFGRFGCRKCGNFTYSSQKLNRRNHSDMRWHYLLMASAIDDKPHRKYWKGKETKKYRRLNYLTSKMRSYDMGEIDLQDLL